jgi:antitoxin MazE
MKTNIVTIGNSQGIRIPKILLEQSRLSGEVEIEVRGESLVISPSRKPRENWNEAFRAAREEEEAAVNDNEIIGENTQNRFDEEEWEW